MYKIIIEKTLNKQNNLFINIKYTIQDLLKMLNIEHYEELTNKIYNYFNEDKEGNFKYKNFEFKINTSIIEEGFENDKYYCIHKIIITTIINN